MASAVSHPVFARAFPAMSRALEAGGIAQRRKDLLTGLAGQIIDIGAGTGPSFGHYAAAVTGVLAVEPEPRLRALAAAAARVSPVPVAPWRWQPCSDATFSRLCCSNEARSGPHRCGRYRDDGVRERLRVRGKD